MRAGAMRLPVTLQRRGLTQDAVGQQVTTWTQIGGGMASISPVRGREYFVASGEKADVTHELRMRSLGIALYPRDRVLYGSRSFDIKSVIDVEERGREWVLMCAEVLHTDG